MMFLNSKEITIRYGMREFFYNWGGWMDIDYAIRKDEPLAIIDESNLAAVTLYERWE